jgi:hypothetical protein
MPLREHNESFSHVRAAVFRNVTPFSLVNGDQLFRQTCSLHFLLSPPSGTAQLSETLVRMVHSYQVTRRHILHA